MSHQPRLVDDLIPVILDAADYWCPRDLASLARVSPAWLACIRKRLYRHPHLPSADACSLLARTLSGNPELIPFIQGIDVSPSITSFTDRPLQDDFSSSLGYLLNLDGARSITLGGLLSLQAERFLHSIYNTERLEKLHIQGDERDSCGPEESSVEWDDSLCFALYNLNSLRLSNLSLTVVACHAPCMMNLTSLILDAVAPPPTFFTHLLLDSPNLTNLHIIAANEEIDKQLRLILTTYPISYFCYEASGKGFRTDSFFSGDSVGVFESVEELHLKDVFITAPTVRTIMASFPNLSVFVNLGRMVSLSASEWEEMVTDGVFSKLHTLGVPAGTCYADGRHFKGWPECSRKQLWNACRDANLRVCM